MRNPPVVPDILTGTPWLLAIGQVLGAEYTAAEQTVPQHLAALVEKLEGPSPAGARQSPPGGDRKDPADPARRWRLPSHR